MTDERLKQHQVDQMWRDYERNRLALQPAPRNGKARRDYFNDVYRFVRNDPVADYEEVADVLALID